MFEPVTIAPSILSADFMELGREVRLIEGAGAGFVHVDVMDGHFVPNLTIGVPVLKRLAALARIPLDVHLMIDNPLVQLPWFLDALQNAAKPAECLVTVHAEPLYGEKLRQAIDVIHAQGVRAGVALRPRTPVEVLAPVISHLDMVLIMSVEPGFSGQSYIKGSEQRVAQTVQMARNVGCAPLIQVDGGIGMGTAPLVAAAGADVLVCGNAVFAADDPARALQDVRAAAESARLRVAADAARARAAAGAGATAVNDASASCGEA